MADQAHDEEQMEQTERNMREQEREIDELGLTVADFENFERDFQSVLVELAGDKSLDKFRLEYEKLHKTFKTSHESEKTHIRRCKELNTQIHSHAVKVTLALKLAS